MAIPRIAGAVLALAVLALPSAGQARFAPSGVGGWPASPAFAPLPASRLDLALGSPSAPFEVLDPAVLGRLSVAAAVPETAPRGIARASLEGGIETIPPFDALPGGIVLGRVASPLDAWTDFDLELDGRGLALVTPAGRHYLPETRREVLAACVEFALRPDDSDVLIDIGAQGVRLARELELASLAPALTRADSAPFRWIPHLPRGKTVIADDAVTFAADPSGDSLVVSCTLEIRAYVPADTESCLQGSLLLASYKVRSGARHLVHVRGPWPGDVPAALLTDLAPVFDLAGSLGVLRWAGLRAPGCLEALREQLREEGAPSVPGPLSLLE